MKINSSEITLANSIIEMFNGNSQFVIENPWYNFNSCLKKLPTIDNYLNSFYTSEFNERKIYQLNTPRILFKEPKSNKFTMLYEIKWGSEKPKTYWIMIADKDGLKEKSGSQNFFVNPTDSELSNLKEEDINLIKLERQLIYGFDIAISAVILGINLSEYQTDESLIKAMYEKYMNARNSEITNDVFDRFLNNYLIPFNDIKIKPVHFFVEYIQKSIKLQNIQFNSPLSDVFKLFDNEKLNKFKQSIQLNSVKNEDEEEKFYLNSTIKFNMKKDSTVKDNKFQTKLITINGNKANKFNLTINNMKDMFSDEYPRKTVRSGYIKFKPTFTFRYIDNPEFPSNFTVSWNATTICLEKPRGIKIDDDTQAVMDLYNNEDLEVDEI